MKDCKIVQDLMPNYIDNLTSEETTKFIKEHLETCKDCTNFYNEMKSKITLENKDNIKQEIDYMKKAKKKMNIGKKLLTIICLLFIILLMLFWREAYNVVCYADICMKYLTWQDAIFEEGGYYEYVYRGSIKDVRYFTEDMLVSSNEDSSNLITSSIQALVRLNENEHALYGEGEDGKLLKSYFPGDIIGDNYKDALSNFPKFYRFDFENEVNFWELMSTIVNVRYIWTTKDNKNVEYYVVNLKDDKVVKINKGTGVPEYIDDIKTLIATPSMVHEEKIEQFIEKIHSSEDASWYPYEDFKKDLSEPNNAVSSSNAEAGEIVSDTFKVKNGDNTSLNGFLSVEEDNNLMYLKITTLTMYNEIKERWNFLRDLTKEDFKHYTVVIVIDKDNTKEIEFSKITNPTERPDIYKELRINEKETTEDCVYSGIMITVPNNEMYEMKKDFENEDMTSPYLIKIVKE